MDVQTDINIECHRCGERVHVFEGETCVEDFMQYVVRKKEFEKFGKVIVMAHNSGMFDGHFVLRHIFDHGGYGTPNIIMNGTKIVLMTIGRKYKFLDSLNYFGVALSKLPGMFNFAEEKGDYPHLFNTAENYNYTGHIPDIWYYSPDTRSPADRSILIKWHKSQVKAKAFFNNRLELIKYCKRDVEILRKACTIFRQTFWEENHIDPFMDAATIAGACNKVFRANYLTPDTIGIIPNAGYRFRDNQSQIGLKWLCWIEFDQNITIQHTGRGKEVRLPGIGCVDGYHAPTNTVFEFLGCYYHACEKHFPVQSSDLTTASTKQLFARRERTERKLERLRKAGYNLVVKKECDFREELKHNPEIDIFLWGNPLVDQEPLNPRHAFNGGRTNANKLHYKVAVGEKIRYVDVNSLYPYENKTYKVPIKHPKIHIGDECLKVDLNTVEGLIKCTVLAPRRLRFPILPSNVHNKLMFYLCRTCAIRQRREKCTHGTDDRSFHGTFVPDELRTALKAGYKILKLDEIWEYDVVQYNKDTKSGGVFTNYVNNFLRLKAQASGYPKGYDNESQKKPM